MKTLLHLTVTMLLLSNFAVAEVIIIDDVGTLQKQAPGLGNGSHYAYPDDQQLIRNDGQFKIISRLEKDGNTYELMYGKDWLMWLRSTTPGKERLDVKFKSINVPDFNFLCELHFLKNGDLLLALSNRIYGYDIVRFKKVGNQYNLHMQAQMAHVRGVRHNEKHIPKGIRFDEQGRFIIDFHERESDVYEFTEGKEAIMLNGKAYEFATKVWWFKDGVRK